MIPHGAADALVARPPERCTAAPTEVRGRTGSRVGSTPSSILTWGCWDRGRGSVGSEAWRADGPGPCPRVRVGRQTHRGFGTRGRALPPVGAVESSGPRSRRRRRVRRPLPHGHPAAPPGALRDVVLLRNAPASRSLRRPDRSCGAGKPVISTRFPHAVELLAGGAGLLVGQRDPLAITAAIRRVLTEPGQAARMSAAAETLAPELSWRSVAGRYLATGNALSRGGDGRAVVGRGAHSPVAVVA